jgi:hypothetical protein
MIVGALKSPSLANRVVAILLSVLALGFLYKFFDSRRAFLFRDFPAMAADAREQMVNARQAYRWIANNTPAEAGILTSRDAQLFLYSGRRAVCQPMRDKAIYRGESPYQSADSAADVARQWGLEYYYVDFHSQGARLKRELAGSPHFRQIYQVGDFAIFRLQGLR